MKFPREEKKFSKGGNFPFHRWKVWTSGGQCSSLGTGHIATPTHEEKGHPSDEECPISGRWICVGLSLDDAVERRRAVRKRHL